MPPLRILPALALLALLPAACDRRAEPAPPPSDPAPVAAEPEIRPGPSWASRVTGAGVSLLLFDAAGAELLHLACVRDRAVMTVEVAPFEAIGSEERLSLGVDGEAFVFVADPTAERASGVQAEAPIDAELLRRLEAATGVSASYGAQTLGPHVPPDPESAGRFVSACRSITAP
jgi:hypothetical protein